MSRADRLEAELEEAYLNGEISHADACAVMDEYDNPTIEGRP